ncbi:DUF3307 domain-containing protein [Siminovitchia sp. 179-K 8D1 HS]|uniref:DUF3307 domain-containing protein n=1 Tax=Siminovitchia sp. 179-K 8D1 HS TaxID=3142385 RepID=UPI0039A03D3F
METTILIFLGLMFAHLLADYPLQGDFLANMKGKNHIILVSHAGIWTGCIAIAGVLLGLDIGLIDVILLFVVHTIADYLKATNKLWYKKLDALKGGLLSDQLIHVGQIVVLMTMTY